MLSIPLEYENENDMPSSMNHHNNRNMNRRKKKTLLLHFVEEVRFSIENENLNSPFLSLKRYD